MFSVRSRATSFLAPRFARSYATPAPPVVQDKRILITGALGQIGAELIPLLRQRYGKENVIASDVRLPDKAAYKEGPFAYIDVLDYHTLAKVAVDHGVDWIIHMSSIMSGLGEQYPERALDVNVTGVRNVLELARNLNLRVYMPSTIAVFSPESGLDMTQEDVIHKPTTVYGITKVFLEQLGRYYHERFGVDFRCLRYPGVISNEALPGGGTTDYAVHIFYNAVKTPPQKFDCPIEKNEYMPMMYMPDCLDATVKILEAPEALLKRRCYNVTGFSFTPEELYKKIQQRVPEFEIEYNPTNLQNIAKTWPNTLDDTAAQKDWQWKPKWDLDAMVDDMLTKLKEKEVKATTGKK